jgi:hypothetical protein
MLDPARLRVDLAVLLVGGGYSRAGAVKEYAARAGGALIDREDEFHH